MNCPECSAVMEEVNRIHVTVDRCSECDGVWFDPDEVQRYVECTFRGLLVAAPDDLDFDGSAGVVCGRCPRCRDHSLTVTVSRSLVHQRCASCGGFFLTRDHINTILRQTPALPMKDSASDQSPGRTILTVADVLLSLIELIA